MNKQIILTEFYFDLCRNGDFTQEDGIAICCDSQGIILEPRTEIDPVDCMHITPHWDDITKYVLIPSEFKISDKDNYHGKVIDTIERESESCVIITFTDGTKLMFDAADDCDYTAQLNITYFKGE